MDSDMILILGVTASGKSRLAFDLAKDMDAEIISVDSMKVYRRMDIGTAKPPRQARAEARYHMIDIVEPGSLFNVAAFVELANQAIEQIKSRGKSVIAVGGTALYLKAMLYGLFEGPGTDQNIREKLKRRQLAEGLGILHKELETVDPAAASRIHPNDSKRIIRALEVYELTGSAISSFQSQFEAPKLSHNWTIMGLRREKAEENSRINQRVKKIIEAGLVDEVRGLLAEEQPLSKQARCAIGYAEIIDYLDGKTNLEEAVELIKKNSRRLAKNQRTWFKTFKDVNWLDVDGEQTPEQILTRARQLLNDI